MKIVFLIISILFFIEGFWGYVNAKAVFHQILGSVDLLIALISLSSFVFLRQFGKK